MADVESVGRVEKIVKSDPARKYIVVSAPGKCNGGAKVTDLLIQCFEEIKNGGELRSDFPFRGGALPRHLRLSGERYPR